MVTQRDAVERAVKKLRATVPAEVLASELVAQAVVTLVPMIPIEIAREQAAGITERVEAGMRAALAGAPAARC